jgi:outer membrane immunogenic protein
MTKRLNFHFVLTVFALAANGFAFAADMAIKAPPAVSVPIYGWSGWYVGGNVGGSLGDVKADVSVAPVTQVFGGPPIPGVARSDTLHPNGFIGGGQIGYNWQLSPMWVVGLEIDIQGAAEKDSSSFANPFDFPLGPPGNVTGTGVTRYQTKIDWFGTVRPRAGYVWGNGGLMTYVTGGLAYGNVNSRGTTVVSGTVPGSSFFIARAFGLSQVNTGWTAGAGIEGKLSIPGWTYKLEYLYMDLGSLDTIDAITGASNASGCKTRTHAHFTYNIFRVGLNYHLH